MEPLSPMISLRAAASDIQLTRIRGVNRLLCIFFCILFRASCSVMATHESPIVQEYVKSRPSVDHCA